ncbi:MAG: 16S rRNA (adenine(1518)-N(6)/adenine(1519)-N(6))-dimethyltransferase RsmA [Candidatus Bathyarchaeia archaeon]
MVEMSLLEETKFLLRKYRITPKKRLGQNFMVNQSTFQLIAEHACLTKNDAVLDIGAGLGFLTKFLAERCEKVLAVEFDSKLLKVLRGQLKAHTNVEIIEGDILKVPVPQFNKVASVPPYNISSQLLPWLFNKNFECAVLVLQKEFAHHLVAKIGSEEYGWLTVITYYNAEVELLDEIPSWMFYPQPEVDSVIVRLKPKKQHPFTVKNEKLLQKLTQYLFNRRNRKVRNVISSFIRSTSFAITNKFENVLESSALFDKRVRELAPEDFGELANALAT